MDSSSATLFHRLVSLLHRYDLLLRCDKSFDVILIVKAQCYSSGLN
jgi:hypothetical protein